MRFFLEKERLSIFPQFLNVNKIFFVCTWEDYCCKYIYTFFISSHSQKKIVVKATDKKKNKKILPPTYHIRV